MDQNERRIIDDLFARLGEAERRAGPRDAEAERLIQGHLGRQPAAPYYMAQAIVVQQEALAGAQARIEQLERELGERPAGGGFLGGLFGGGERAAPRSAAPRRRGRRRRARPLVAALRPGRRLPRRRGADRARRRGRRADRRRARGTCSAPDRRRRPSPARKIRRRRGPRRPTTARDAGDIGFDEF